MKRGEAWGTGSKHFLRELFEQRDQICAGIFPPAKGGRGDSPYKEGSFDKRQRSSPPAKGGQGGSEDSLNPANFFNHILEPLFYEALGREHEQDYYSRFNCRIPFLNGGLFEPINGYDWINTDILLPNSLFSNKNQTKTGDTGDGILDIFDRYNFTVNEDEPLEKEVAVDPEMLGKVFENLLEVQDRKSKGTYYTPREIVHYMCQESLINYLFSVFSSPSAEDFPDKGISAKGGQGGSLNMEGSLDKRQVLSPPDKGGLGGLKSPRKPAKTKKSDLSSSGGETAKIQKSDISDFIKISDSSVEHDTVYQEEQSKQRLTGHKNQYDTSNPQEKSQSSSIIKEGQCNISNPSQKELQNTSPLQGESQNTTKKGRYSQPHLPKAIIQNADLIDKALEDIKVCDPAVGSGAFPVGMMNEIVRARCALTPHIKPEDSSKGTEAFPPVKDFPKKGTGSFPPDKDFPDKGTGASPPDKDFPKKGERAFPPDKGGQEGLRTPYHFKRLCIKHSLYGVDIDPGAIEIAKLRLWLSLVVDEEDRETVQPLPNLDYKMLCGNSLLGLKKDDGFGTKDAFYEQNMKELSKKKNLFFNETSTSKKQKLKKEIDQLMDKICVQTFKGTDEKTKTQKVFDFKIYFFEVFQKKQGFDIVIANPPYVRADSGPDYLSFRKKLELLKIFKTLYEKWDIMIPFIERGLNLANKKGDLIYIVSNAICTSKYAYKLLDLIQEKYFMRSINYFEKMKVFDAGVLPIVFHVGKSEKIKETVKIVRNSFFDNIKSKDKISIRKFKSMGRNAFRKKYDPIALKEGVIDLENICYISYGLRPNSDERYWKGEFTTKDIVSLKKTKIHRKKFIEGKDIESYRIKRIRYLEWDTERAPKKFSRPTFPELYVSPKIIRGRMNPGIYDDQNIICSANAIVLKKFSDLKNVYNRSLKNSLRKSKKIRSDMERLSEKFNLKYVLSILNSKYGFYFLNQIRRHKQKNYFYPDDLKKLPIRDISLEKQKPLIDLVDKILKITKTKDYLQTPAKQAQVREYKKQIDQLVYKFYKLTSAEIKIVEENTK